MAANKKTTKSGAASTPKKKPSAAAHARTRAQAKNNLPEAPRVRSNKTVGQSRFPGETPLTGEDRPRNRAGGKQQGYAQDRKVDRGRTPVHPGEQSMRRARGMKQSGRTRGASAKR